MDPQSEPKRNRFNQLSTVIPEDQPTTSLLFNFFARLTMAVAFVFAVVMAYVDVNNIVLLISDQLKNGILNDIVAPTVGVALGCYFLKLVYDSYYNANQLRGPSAVIKNTGDAIVSAFAGGFWRQPQQPSNPGSNAGLHLSPSA